jgi:hypothetical protein
MDAEFERGRKTKFANAEGKNMQILLELLFKLGQVSDVIGSLVKASGEFGGYRLRGNFLLSDHGQDEKKLRRGLGPVRFIHGDFGHKPALAFMRFDMAIDLARGLDCEEKLVGCSYRDFARDGKWRGDARDGERSKVRLSGGKKLFRDLRGGRFANFLGDIKSEKTLASIKRSTVFKLM